MEKNPIILLHGWNLKAERYHQLEVKLKKSGYPVYIPDLPGFGSRTNLKKAMILDDYVKFLSDFVKKRGLTRFILIGHSFGGRVALKYTVANSSKVIRLVLTGVPGYTPVSGLKVFIFLLLSKSGKLVFSLPPLSSYRQMMTKLIYRLAGSSDYMRTEGFLRPTFISIKQEKLEQVMRRISVSTLLIWGEKDQIVHPSVAEKMNKTIINSKLIIVPNSNHNLPLINPELFWQIIEKN